MSVVSYEVADMFAARAGEGCAVGIVPDAEALTAEQMLAVARKIGTTETAFVLSADPGADYRVRVFTPDGE
jgi:trans-2,3-dihydro-3-hydroxyanthranilate isomerase